MAKTITRALKNAVSKNADDAIKGSRNIINLSSDSYKIKDAIMPKSDSFSTRPIRSGNFTARPQKIGPLATIDKAGEMTTRNLPAVRTGDYAISKSRQQTGLSTKVVDSNIVDAQKGSYSIKDAVMPKSGKFATSAASPQGPIIVEPTPLLGDIKVKSGNFTTDSRDYKIARNRARNEAKNINNGVINAQGPNPNLLRLEDRATKMENAMNMIDAGMPQGMTVLEQLDKSNELKTRTPVRYTGKEKVRKTKTTDDALHNQIGVISNEKPVTNRILQPGIASGTSNPENKSILQQAQEKVKGNNFVYNMAAMGVGGGLVLNMANNKGQQSNAQLYGQY